MITSGPCTDVGRSLPLNLCCVCASQSRHEREQMLPLGVLGHVVQFHRETADRAREALRHVLDPANGPVLKAGGNQGSFIDAGAAVSSGEWVRTSLQLPIQNVIETVHGGGPFYMRPVLGMVAPRMGLWSIRRVRRSARPAAR